MTRLWRPILAVLVASALSACAYSEGVYVYAMCLEDLSEHAKGVDWSEARTVEVDIVNGGEFSPSYIRFNQKEPQILRIRNTDNKLRLFRAPKFFSSIAIGKLTVGDREYTELMCRPRAWRKSTWCRSIRGSTISTMTRR